MDPIACRTISENRPAIKLFPEDIRLLTATRLKRELNMGEGSLFAIVGGPPCQAFSTAGHRMGLNDERGNVFLHFIDLIAQLKPKYAIFENVRGLLSAPLNHRPHAERGEGQPPLRPDELPGGALLHILNLLEAQDYHVTFTLYNTANFGVPQIRERLIFFASREGRAVPYMRPTHDQNGDCGLPQWKTLREAISHLQGKPFHAAKFPEKRLRFYRLLKAGNNWRDLPEPLQKEAMGGSYYAGGGKTGFYRRLAWDKPSPTLVTSPSMPATDLCHPAELRPLSVEEYCAIQTFPPDYSLAGKIVDQYRQVGNAVPCHFGEIIGRHILDFDQHRIEEPQEYGQLSRYRSTDHRAWREAIEQPVQETLF
jgi:DNA (cytosine-5)-methyltransferase 1